MKLTQLMDLFWPPLAQRLGFGLSASPLPVRSDIRIQERDHDNVHPSVEFVGIDQIDRHAEAWADLAARASEPNVFFEPSFALPAGRHLAETGNIGFLLAWDQPATTPNRRLLALWPFGQPGFFGLAVNTWIHEFSCAGAPLLDGGCAFACLDALLSFLSQSVRRACVLTAAQLKMNGPTFALLSHYAAMKGLDLKVVGRYERAALDATVDGLRARDVVSSKKRKELQRQFRRLSELGPVTFGLSHDTATLTEQIESFLVLEANGWKGRAGGAFLSKPQLAAFLRTMTREMADQRKCRVYWMACGDKVVAANIVLIEGSTAYFWKTAYDEEFAFASPGVLLTMNMTDSLLNDPRISIADSCSIPNHPMIDPIWLGRIPMANVMLSLRGERSRAFDGAVQGERIRLKLREKTKAALSHLNLG